MWLISTANKKGRFVELVSRINRTQKPVFRQFRWIGWLRLQLAQMPKSWDLAIFVWTTTTTTATTTTTMTTTPMTTTTTTMIERITLPLAHVCRVMTGYRLVLLMAILVSFVCHAIQSQELLYQNKTHLIFALHVLCYSKLQCCSFMQAKNYLCWPCLQALHIQTGTHSNTYSFACILSYTHTHTHTDFYP